MVYPILPALAAISPDARCLAKTYRTLSFRNRLKGRLCDSMASSESETSFADRVYGIRKLDGVSVCRPCSVKMTDAAYLESVGAAEEGWLIAVTRRRPTNRPRVRTSHPWTQSTAPPYHARPSLSSRPTTNTFRRSSVSVVVCGRTRTPGVCLLDAILTRYTVRNRDNS